MTGQERDTERAGYLSKAMLLVSDRTRHRTLSGLHWLTDTGRPARGSSCKGVVVTLRKSELGLGASRGSSDLL